MYHYVIFSSRIRNWWVIVSFRLLILKYKAVTSVRQMLVYHFISCAIFTTCQRTYGQVMFPIMSVILFRGFHVNFTHNTLNLTPVARWKHEIHSEYNWHLHEFIPRKIHGWQTGQWSVVLRLNINCKCSLKMGYYIRGSCILMRWSDSLHLAAHYGYSLDIGNTGLSALMNIDEQVHNWYLTIPPPPSKPQLQPAQT